MTEQMPVVSFEDRLIYQGQRIDLLLRRVATNSGGHAHREVVRHPGAVVLLPILPDGNLVLIRNYRHTIGQELWELPAGTLQPPEAPELCAARELAEETGYQAGRLESLGYFYPAPGISTEKMYGFVARELTPGPQHLEENEQIQVESLPLATVKTWIAQGKIQDAKTMALIFKFLLQEPAYNI